MKSSLRNQLFVYLVLSTFVVVIANRSIATYLISFEINRDIEHEMQRGLTACAHHLDDRQTFLDCYRDINLNSITRQVSDFFVICRDGALGAGESTNNWCGNIKATQVAWVDEIGELSLVQQWTAPFRSGAEWRGARVRVEGQTASIFLSTKNIDAVLSQVWSLRDTKLIYVVPIVLFLWAIAIIAIMRVVMSSVVSLEKSLLALTPSTFDKAMAITTKYKEFESITNIYRDLCIRLADGFRRARSFTADASHEIKTPLTILRGNAERLIADLPHGMPAQLIARGMADEVERLIKISDQLLLLSQADSDALTLQWQDFDLSEFMDALADDAVVFEKNMTIEKDIEAGLVWRCDTILAKQLIHNLYTNAVKYNKHGGHIGFSLRRLRGDFELRVTNSSLGVSPDIAARVFQRFYRGDTSHSRHIDGLGLGLSICMEIAKAHGGGLTFEVDDQDLVTVALNAPLQI